MAKPKIDLMPMLKKMAQKHEKMESPSKEKREEMPPKKGKSKGKGC